MCLMVNQNDIIQCINECICVCMYNVHPQKLKGRVKVNINNLHIPVSANTSIYY